MLVIKVDLQFINPHTGMAQSRVVVRDSPSKFIKFFLKLRRLGYIILKAQTIA